MKFSEIKLAIIGLGYVGLPLAVEFGKKRSVMCFDVNQTRIKELKNGIDRTFEVNPQNLKDSESLYFSSNIDDLRECNTYIITVPTPIDDNNSPNLKPLINASAMIGKILSRGDIVIYESTVYPGATEEICVPELEKHSQLTFNNDFFVGYSPERINPGDKENTLTTIVKITSGSTPKIAKTIDTLYNSIIPAGTHATSSIKVAEAAKVIENTQRDLNIAVINEFAKIFNILGIDTQEILNAAETKWNFLPFKPGLVGGHCISVDPYYLTHKAKEVGYHPEVILAGRRINDGMGQYVSTQLVKLLSQNNITMDNAKVLILGITFKGDCPDVRNTKIIDIYHELRSFNLDVDVFDNWANKDEVKQEYGINLIADIKEDYYDAIVLAVDHSDYKTWGVDKIKTYGKQNHVIYDLKYVLPLGSSNLRL